MKYAIPLLLFVSLITAIGLCGCQNRCGNNTAPEDLPLNIINESASKLTILSVQCLLLYDDPARPSQSKRLAIVRVKYQGPERLIGDDNLKITFHAQSHFDGTTFSCGGPPIQTTVSWPTLLLAPDGAEFSIVFPYPKVFVTKNTFVTISLK